MERIPKGDEGAAAAVRGCAGVCGERGGKAGRAQGDGRCGVGSLGCEGRARRVRDDRKKPGFDFAIRSLDFGRAEFGQDTNGDFLYDQSAGAQRASEKS